MLLTGPVPVRQAPPPPPPANIPEETPAPVAMETDEPSHEAASEKPEGKTQLPSYDPEVIAKLEERRGQYRQAAVAAKRAGNKLDALKFAQIVKVVILVDY